VDVFDIGLITLCLFVVQLLFWFFRFFLLYVLWFKCVVVSCFGVKWFVYLGFCMIGVCAKVYIMFLVYYDLCANMYSCGHIVHL
jgi:hypothetical protein